MRQATMRKTSGRARDGVRQAMLAAGVVLALALPAFAWLSTQQATPATAPSSASRPSPQTFDEPGVAGIVPQAERTTITPGVAARISDATPAGEPGDGVIPARGNRNDLVSPLPVDKPEAAVEVTTARTDGPQVEGQAPTSGAEPNAEADEETLFITIVGDETFISRGPAAERRPLLAGLGLGAGAAPQQNAVAANPLVSQPDNAGRVTARSGDPQPAAPGATGGTGRAPANPAPTNAGASGSGQSGGGANLSDLERSLAEDPGYDPREWPQASCPWTLPAGSDQSYADTLRDQYGCRYLSGCSVETRECTFYYQGV